MNRARPWRLNCAVAVGIALAPIAHAQVPSVPYRWNNVVVGSGGFAPNIVFSRAERGLAYLRTDMGGGYRWEVKLQRWVPLQDANPVSSFMGIESIAPDPIDPDVVYLAAGMYQRERAAILRSGNRGASWTVTPVPFRMGGNEDGRGLGERIAIDPNRTSTLLFGSRHDGLQRSDDRGTTWHKVTSFPHTGLGLPESRRQTHAGISFVLFDRSTGRSGDGSRTIYAGVADPGARHLYRSINGGRTWLAVPGGPGPSMLPVKGELDVHGNLYVAYSTGVGPNGVKSGSVWALDTRNGRWTEITPDRSSVAEGGYMGLSLDARVPGRIAVATLNRWQRGDTIWLSTNAGRTWTSLRERSRRDPSAVPWLKWGQAEAEFGHWITGLAIDPFESGTIAYTTGATVYGTDESLRSRLLWKPWVKGIEQTAVITLVSPTGGAHLISGFGDIGGFVHDRLDRSPPVMHLNPRLTNTNSLDYAGRAPAIVVRSGSLHAEQIQDVSLAWSDDGGKNWRPLRVPPISVSGGPSRRYDLRGEAAIAVSADGSAFIVATPVPMVTRDRGITWSKPTGLPPNTRAIADKFDAALFYAIDFARNRLLVSRDGARSFAPAAGDGLPASLAGAIVSGRESQSPLRSNPARGGELWLRVGGKLFVSRDAAQSFRVANGDDMVIEDFGLGKGAPGQPFPALYSIGIKAGVRGIWRSTDGGATWYRINDEGHQWGLRFRAISGDPRLMGRVYVATDGRGIVYGDPQAMTGLR